LSLIGTRPAFPGRGRFEFGTEDSLRTDLRADRLHNFPIAGLPIGRTIFLNRRSGRVKVRIRLAPSVRTQEPILSSLFAKISLFLVSPSFIRAALYFKFTDSTKWFELRLISETQTMFLHGPAALLHFASAIFEVSRFVNLFFG